jgi:RNase P subunit RPR2
MVNPKLEYLKQLLSIYHSKECGEFINSKLLNLRSKENSFFCIGCSRTFIPKVNCIAKLENEILTIKCKKCDKIFKLNNLK